MSDVPELEKLFDPIRKAMADMEDERLRFSHISATIRVNAMRRGATDEQISRFLTGEENFIGWMSDTLIADLDRHRRADLPPTLVESLVEAAQWARNRLEIIADEAWHGDGRDLKRSIIGVFADFDAALAAVGSQVPEEIKRQNRRVECPGNDCLRTDGFVCGPDDVCGILEGRATPRAVEG